MANCNFQITENTVFVKGKICIKIPFPQAPSQALSLGGDARQNACNKIWLPKPQRLSSREQNVICKFCNVTLWCQLGPRQTLINTSKRSIKKGKLSVGLSDACTAS